MKFRVTYDDGTPIRVEREATLSEQAVTFQMHGSTAVLDYDGGAKDLPEVVEAVENLPFVQATKVKE